MKIFRILLLLLLFVTISENILSADVDIIRRVKFKGNKELSDKELKANISFSPSTRMGRRFFKQNISYYSDIEYNKNVNELKHFYQSEGFLDVHFGEPYIKTKGKKNQRSITFYITENKPVVVDTVAFKFVHQNEELQNFTSDILEKRNNLLYSKGGVRFRDEYVLRDKENICNYLVNRGYPYSNAMSHILVDTINKKATIIWEIERGPLGYFGDISINGQNRTSEKIISKQIAFKQGDVYSRNKLDQTQQQIFQLGTFRVTTVKAQLSSEQPDSLPINIRVSESPRTATRFGIGYGLEDNFRGFIDYTILNFPTGVQRLNIYIKHSGTEPYRIESTLTQPAVFSPNSTLAFSPFIKKLKEPGYELLNYGTNLMLLQKFFKNVSGSLNPYYEQVVLDTTSIADLTLPVSAVLRNYSKSGLAVGVMYNSATPRFSPETGLSVALNTKINSVIIKGVYPFYKYIFEIKYYNRLNYNIVTASKIKIGSIIPTRKNNYIPVEERFFAGGSRSVRGWAHQQLGPLDSATIPIGGNSIIEISIEPRIKIKGPLSFVVFSDIGNVWMNYNQLNLMELRFSAGAGLRYSTPIGPIGIDFARPIFDKEKKWQFHLNIGNSF
ncbi:MAG: BamA/TamA family outer membrane protein [Marinilabiliaceae bacterium]|nr:BamA/TamA family outer membrane protein [Marinilabiliaceae bacterium]